MFYTKGSFYSEGTDTFVISSNRQTLLFSWAWILNLRYFRWLKSCQIRAWVSSEGWNSKMKPCLSLQSHFRLLFDMIRAFWNITNSKFKLRKIIKFGVWRNDKCISTFWIKATFAVVGRVEKFHFTWCGYIGFRTRCYVKFVFISVYVKLMERKFLEYQI